MVAVRRAGTAKTVAKVLQQAAIAPCDPGDAKVTDAFDLDPPVRHIIHTVGPVWEGGTYGEADVLARCYRSDSELLSRERESKPDPAPRHKIDCIVLP